MTSKSPIYFLICLVFLYSCKGHHDEYHGIMDKIEAQSITINKDTIASQFDDDQLVEITDAGVHFYINQRKGQITSFACTECHNQDLSKMVSQAEFGTKKAHWNIKINHAGEDIMNCATCHDSNNLDQLKNNTGKTIDFNLSYQLCAQCHSKQVTDWKGGAHGKNLSGWRSKRVSKLCVECHNPHQPGFESKWPERYNTQMAAERE